MKKRLLIVVLCSIGWSITAKAVDPLVANGGGLKQTIYIDFGKSDGTNGNITNSPDKNGNYWNNATATAYGSKLNIVGKNNEPTGYVLEITKNFSANGILNGGLITPSEAHLGDLAISTATQDYFFIDGTAGNGSFRIRNLNKNRAYKFQVFGSRLQTGSEERIGYLSFAGSTGSNGTLQMTGKGIGANGENQNTSRIYSTGYVFPDFKGEIDFQMAIKSGGYAHINAMKIEEYSDIDPQAVKQSFYIDLGRCDGNNGNHTLGADANNHYWNNAFSNDNFNVPKDSKLTLINSANVKTEMEMTIGTEFRSNGRNSGGLLNPNANLLGDLAIASATEDYLFVEKGGTTVPGVINFHKLNPALGYRFHVFGSRETTEDRMGLFTFTGINSCVGAYKMSGSNSGGAGINRSTDHVFVSDVIRPDINGSIQFQINIYASSFAYINVIKIEECSEEPIIKATSISIAGTDIAESGQTSKITSTVLPAGATYPAIQWSVDDPSVASIDNQGIIYPKTNGTIKATARIEYDDRTLSDEIEIRISGQLGNVGFTGTAVEENAEMRMITDMQGTITNQFEIYTSLKGSGTMSFYRDLGNGEKMIYGAGTTAGSLTENGAPIQTSESGPVRIRIDLTTNTYIILPITSLNIVGSSTPTGNDLTKGLALEYEGNGIWGAYLLLNGGDPKFSFVLNKEANECFKRVKGTNRVILQSQGEKYGVAMEEIRSNMNGGQYYVQVNLKDYTYSVSCGEVEAQKISYMGSSVANGSGAQNMQGYAYMYTQLLNKRAHEGRGMKWETSNISIGGNTTGNLLDRWERDLLSNCSSYVIYGLSLGNEGVHERGEAAYNSYRDGMLKAIQQAENAGITPVIANNYTRGDFNESDYNYVKKLNLLIHEWDLPSINTLGAIDDGKGHWASGFENDAAHPNTAGHQEFFYAMVPSLFDALKTGKPSPKRVQSTHYELGKKTTANQIKWIPEETMHSFTVSFDIRTTETGVIAWFENESGNGFLRINSDGTLSYESPLKGSIRSTTTTNVGVWKRITLTHYYAWGNTMLYVNDVKIGELPEKLAPTKFVLGSIHAPNTIAYRELFCWRAGMNAEEIAYVNQGKMMKSSLEIYAPLGDAEPLKNLAQSTNELTLVNEGFIVDQKLYIDFGKNDGANGNLTTKDHNGNTWNNAINTAVGTQYALVNAYNQPSGIEMTLSTSFMSNGIKNGGLLFPEANLLGDLAVHTATQDYFYIEENKGAAKGGIDLKNLRPNKAYKLHLFGSRSSEDNRCGILTLAGLNSFEGRLQMGGIGIAQGNVTGDAKNQNDSHILVSETIYPDANGTIHIELTRYNNSKFAYINALKIEEYSVGYTEGTSPIISATPIDGMGVRSARIHSASGGYNNEGPENLLLDKNASGNANKKWCYNSANNFVIIELSDYYDVDKFVIEDCKTRETSNPNLSEYYIYVSTTGTADSDWKEVAHEINQSDVMFKTNKITPTKARYIKLVPKISSNTVRIYSFHIFGRKSFDSIHKNDIISVGKPIIQCKNVTNVQNAPVALFDGELKAANSKWTATGNDSFVVVDLLDSYAITGFQLYDSKSVENTGANIKGYRISLSQDALNWAIVVDATNKENDNIKEDLLTTVAHARYVKLEIPTECMPISTILNLYEFTILGKLNVKGNDVSLKRLEVQGCSLTPSFESERMAYSVHVAKEVDSITIKAEAKNETAEISGDLGDKNLALGDNQFFITVKSADGTTTQSYTLNVNRASMSAVANIESLSIDGIKMEPAFSPSTRIYRMETNSHKATIAAHATSPLATISGTGEIALTDGLNELKIEAVSEDGKNHEVYTIMLYNTTNLLSVASPDGKGKRIVNICEYSGMTGVNENPFRMLRGWKENLSGDRSMKWCDTSASPYVIFSLADLYTINHIEFRDCKMVEPDWANIPGYSLFVSATDTLSDSWTEVIRETGVGGINEKAKSFDAIDARYIKFVPSKGDNAIRIYGFDIYGKYKEPIENERIVSAGKTILNCSAGINDMLTAANTLDGQNGTVWEFSARTATIDIDLEKSYLVDKFVLSDSLNFVSGYKVSVSENETDWTPIAEKTFENKNESPKVIILDSPITTRYVQLTIPRTAQLGTTRIREFEVHRTDKTVGTEKVDGSGSGELILSPNPVAKGEKFRVNHNGIIRFYSLTGSLVAESSVNNNTLVPTTCLPVGSYVVRLDDSRKAKVGKLIIK